MSWLTRKTLDEPWTQFIIRGWLLLPKLPSLPILQFDYPRFQRPGLSDRSWSMVVSHEPEEQIVTCLKNSRAIVITDDFATDLKLYQGRLLKSRASRVYGRIINSYDLPQKEFATGVSILQSSLDDPDDPTPLAIYHDLLLDEQV